jgi:hypothetical protein
MDVKLDDLNDLILYHGTSYDFNLIDLNQCKPYKDFGQGFYTSADVRHAISMANRNAQMRAAKHNLINSKHITIHKWLYTFQFARSKSIGMNIKIFPNANRDWGRLITLNRTSKKSPHGYDIVIGPTANDLTNPTIQFYMSGGLGNVGSDEAIDELIRLLMPYKLPSQHFFATDKSITCLTLIRKEQLP